MMVEFIIAFVSTFLISFGGVMIGYYLSGKDSK